MPTKNTTAKGKSIKQKGTTDPMIATGILILQSCAIVTKRIKNRLEREIKIKILIRKIRVFIENEKIKLYVLKRGVVR